MADLGLPEDPILRVVQVLHILSTEVHDPTLRRQADQWLIDFQKADETTHLSVSILKSALLPQSDGSLIAHFGVIQPAAQQQLLFFLAQTLNVKLQRELNRPQKDTFFKEITPPEFIIMSQQAAILSHQSLSRCLAKTAGQCIILNGDCISLQQILDFIVMTGKNELVSITRVGEIVDLAYDTFSNGVAQTHLSHAIDDLEKMCSNNLSIPFELLRVLAQDSPSRVNESFEKAVYEVLKKSLQIFIGLQCDGVLSTLHKASRIFHYVNSAIDHALSVYPILTGHETIEVSDYTLDVTNKTIQIMAMCLSYIMTFSDLIEEIYKSMCILSKHELTDETAQLIETMLLPAISFVRWTLDVIVNLKICRSFSLAAPNLSERFREQFKSASTSVVGQTEPLFNEARNMKMHLESSKRDRRRDVPENYDERMNYKARRAALYAWILAEKITSQLPCKSLVGSLLERVCEARTIHFIHFQGQAVEKIIQRYDLRQQEIQSVARLRPDSPRFEFAHVNVVPQTLDGTNLMEWDGSECSQKLVSAMLRFCVVYESRIGNIILGDLGWFLGLTYKATAPVLAVISLFSDINLRPVNPQISFFDMTVLLIMQGVDMTVEVSRNTCPIENSTDPIHLLTMGLDTVMTERSLHVRREFKTVHEFIRTCNMQLFDDLGSSVVSVDEDENEDDYGISNSLSGLRAVCVAIAGYARRAAGITKIENIDTFALHLRNLIIKRCMFLSRYPSNYELLSSHGAKQFAEYRGELRRIAKLMAGLFQKDDEKMISYIETRLEESINFQTPEQFRNLRRALVWKDLESLYQGLSILSQFQCVSNRLITSRQILSWTSGHRGLLRSMLWLLAAPGIQSNMSVETIFASIDLSRVSLRLNQFDETYPMSSNEDHLGAVTLNKIGHTLESGQNRIGLNQWVNFHQISYYQDFLNEALYNINSTSFAKATMALSSLPLMIYGLGQIMTLLRPQFEDDVLKLQINALDQIGQFLIQALNSQASAPVINSLIQTLNAMISSIYPLRVRPHSKCLTKMGIKRSSEGWAQELLSPKQSSERMLFLRSCQDTSSKLISLYWDTLKSILHTIAEPCGETAEQFEAPYLLDSFADLISMLLALPNVDNSEYKADILQLIIVLAESKPSFCGLYAAALALLNSSTLELTINPSSQSAHEHIKNLQRAVMTSTESMLGQLNNDCLSMITKVGERSQAVLSVLHGLAQKGLIGESRPIILLSLLSQLSASISLLTVKLDDVSLEHILPNASFDVMTALCEDQNRSAFLMPLFVDQSFGNISQLFLYLLHHCQRQLAIIGGGQISEKFCHTTSTYPSLIWILSVGFVLQTSIVETPCAPPKALQRCQDGLLSILIDMRSSEDLSRSLTACRTLLTECLVDSVSPLKWASSQENQDIFVREISKRLFVPLLDLPASSGPVNSKSEQGVVRRVSDPGLMKVKSALDDPLTMISLRRSVRRNCALINVSKRPCKPNPR